MENNKFTTCDQYVINQLEKTQEELKQNVLENKVLSQENVRLKNLIQNPEIKKTEYIYYYFEVASEYRLEDSGYTKEDIEEVLQLNDEELFNWGSSHYRNNCGLKQPIINIVERSYNFQLNYFGTVIAIDVYKLNSENKISASSVVIDQEQYFSEYENCIKCAITKARKQFESFLKYVSTTKN